MNGDRGWGWGGRASRRIPTFGSQIPVVLETKRTLSLNDATVLSSQCKKSVESSTRVKFSKVALSMN